MPGGGGAEGNVDFILVCKAEDGAMELDFTIVVSGCFSTEKV